MLNNSYKRSPFFIMALFSKFTIKHFRGLGKIQLKLPIKDFQY